MEISEIKTPPAQEGIWTLIAPDGRKWQAESPIKVVEKEQRERVPERIGMLRILEFVKSDGKLPDEDNNARCICPICGQPHVYRSSGEEFKRAFKKIGTICTMCGKRMDKDTVPKDIETVDEKIGIDR